MPHICITKSNAGHCDWWLVSNESGIPGPGDMDRLVRQCAERGVHLGGVSWRG